MPEKQLTQLVITPSYPPVDSSVTLINIKIIERLEQLGVRTVVLTVDPDDVELPVNPRLSELFPSNRHVYRVKTWEKGGALRRRARALLRKTPLFNAPDYHLFWEINAIASIRKIARRHAIDIIHSISAPYCSHIVGLFAKKILDKPWMCHLDDFWADQPLEHFDRYRSLNYWIEGKCFQQADAIISSSREILGFASRRYPPAIQDKFIYIPPGYTAEHYPNSYHKIDRKYVMTFLGVFYRNFREPITLFKALRILKVHQPKLFQKLDIRLVGVDPAQWNEAIKHYELQSAVRCQQRVDYFDSLRLMKESAVLLHFGFMNGKYDQDIHVSGKLFEYFGAERLVLGITTKTGPVADIIGSANGIVCDYNDPTDIARAIEEITARHTPQQLYQWRMPDRLREYETSHVAASYHTLMTTMTGTTPTNRCDHAGTKKASCRNDRMNKKSTKR